MLYWEKCIQNNDDEKKIMMKRWNKIKIFQVKMTPKYQTMWHIKLLIFVKFPTFQLQLQH
jgi:hypothetical protein